jgi:hypothetical protein
VSLGQIHEARINDDSASSILPSSKSQSSGQGQSKMTCPNQFSIFQVVFIVIDCGFFRLWIVVIGWSHSDNM